VFNRLKQAFYRIVLKPNVISNRFVIAPCLSKLQMNRKLLVFVMLITINASVYSQTCGNGLVPCGKDKKCLPPMECGRNPPPPGLVVPIDTNIQFLLIAGLGLGIYFFGFQKKGLALFSAFENKK